MDKIKPIVMSLTDQVFAKIQKVGGIKPDFSEPNLPAELRHDHWRQAEVKMLETIKFGPPRMKPAFPEPTNRVDFEFSTSRQAEGRSMERNNLDPPRMFPHIPTPREELNWHDPPALRRPPIDMLRHVTPGDPVTPPTFDPPKPLEPIAYKMPEPPKLDYLDPFKKKKEPWEY